MGNTYDVPVFSELTCWIDPVMFNQLESLRFNMLLESRLVSILAESNDSDSFPFLVMKVLEKQFLIMQHRSLAGLTPSRPKV